MPEKIAQDRNGRPCSKLKYMQKAVNIVKWRNNQTITTPDKPNKHTNKNKLTADPIT